jgi:hypothetical protein
MDGETLVLPIGHGLGVVHSGGGEHVRQVRLGADLNDLDDEDFGLWSFAHGVSDPGTGRTPSCTGAGLRAAAGETGALERLLRDGLLAEVAIGTPRAVEFASSHRLLPLALGLGNTAEQPGLYAVGLLYQPVVFLSGPLYDLWQWAHVAPNLWAACRDTAEIAVTAGVGESGRAEPEQVLTGALGSLHELLAAGVACLDVADGRNR